MNSLYPINHDWFSTINRDVAYMLGFITADGCVYNIKSRQTIINIAIHPKDISVLEYFKEFISPTRPIKKAKRGEIYFSFNSNIVSKDLEKYQIIPRKTGKEKFPKDLLGDFIPDYLRGLIDGDGSVFIRYNKNQDTYYVNFELCSASEDFLIDIKNYFNNYGNISKFKNRNAFRWCVNANKELCDMYNTIYYDDSLFCLERKKNIFKRVFDDINTHKTTKQEKCSMKNE